MKNDPVVKWVGSKRQLLPMLMRNIPKKFNRYFEPFIGAGSLFFQLGCVGGYIADLNEELINLYNVIRDCPDTLINSVYAHINTKEYFLAIRGADRKEEYNKWDAISRASRFIYLNRTCYRGLYRVNSKGQFNVPFGYYKNPKLIDKQVVLRSSALLKKTEIQCTHFYTVLNYAKKGDFVYLDPPYMPLNRTSNFTSYTLEGFNMDSQIQLKDMCDALTSKGVYFLQSNSNSKVINDLYSEYRIVKVFVDRGINRGLKKVLKGNKERRIAEILIKNY